MSGGRERVTKRIALEGSSNVGKSVLLHRLTTGKFEIVQATIGGGHAEQSFNVDGTTVDTDILDTQGIDRTFFTLNQIHHRSADVIIAFFDISNSNTLGKLITDRIPYLHKEYPTKPILLVGTKADIRQEQSLECSLFPYDFGQCLAHLVGAVKYVECSSKLNQGVHEVFEEAIRASFQSTYSGIVDGDLKRLLVSQTTMDDKWKSVVDKVDLSRICPKLEPALQSKLESSDMQLCAALSNETVSVEDVIACENLDVDTIRLAIYTPDLDFIRFKYAKSSSTLWCTDLFKTTKGRVNDLARDVFILKNTISMQFVKQDCSSINEFLCSCGTINVKSLVIVSCTGTLVLKFLHKLEGIENLVIIDSKVDLSTLKISSKMIPTLNCLVLKHCDTAPNAEMPAVIGELIQLEVLDVTCNSFKKLPESLRGLGNLNTLRCDHDQIVFPPQNVLEKSAKDVVQYLKELDGESTANREAKMMVVGQECVGKSTLVKSLKRRFGLTKTNPPPKTDGVEISVLHLENFDCKVYDLAGDVEYLNTHALFFSPECLHLAVFDLSQFTVSEQIRSSDQFCRLELWLQTIACQDPNSYVIIVGTHADHHMLSPEVLARLRNHLDQLLDRFRSVHPSSFQRIDDCLLCNKLTDNQDEDTNSDTPIEAAIPLETSDNTAESTAINTEETDVLPDETNGSTLEPTEILPTETYDDIYDQSVIPHILGKFEVSGVKNKNVKNLKRQLQCSLGKIKEYTHTEKIPIKWLAFRTSVKTKLSKEDDLRKQPIYQLSQVDDLAHQSEIYSQKSIVAMLRFFHSQGDFLWYEDIPEMKDVVILDPQWLANQLRTLISHLPRANAICEGVLHQSKLSEIWCDLSEETCSRLMSLFRSVGLCFGVSESEDLFPCKLPVGWPDREMWPPLPKPNEKQTSLIFLFSFIPPSFFPDLIVAVNKKRESFPFGVQPLYYRFNVVYMTKEESVCPLHEEGRLREKGSQSGQQKPLEPQRIHIELMPYNNRIKVTIRGPRPCCIIPDVRSTMEMVKSRRYPGITIKERVVCPECDMKKVHNPYTMALDDYHEGVCQRGHNFGTIQDVLTGKLSSAALVPSVIAQTGRTIGEVLEDHFCPKLFAVLPINLHSLSLKDRFVYSYLRDGYGVHLLCESPEEWHFVTSPGFRVGKPKEFFKKYGKRVCQLLRVISALETPFKVASVFEPHCKAGQAAAKAADKMYKELKVLLDDYLKKYPHLKSSLGSPKDDLKDLKSSRGLQRSELSRFLEVAAKGRDFGPLTCTYVDKCDEWLWLCEEHNQKYEIVER